VKKIKMPCYSRLVDADDVRTPHAEQFFELLGGNSKDGGSTDQECQMRGWRFLPARLTTQFFGTFARFHRHAIPQRVDAEAASA
jgi:hypothetical protein